MNVALWVIGVALGMIGVALVRISRTLDDVKHQLYRATSDEGDGE